MAYLLLFFSKFQISNIEILGNQKIQTIDIEKLISRDLEKKILGIGTKSIFLANTSQVVKDILDQVPLIEKIDVHKKLPNKISFIIKERNQFALFCSDFIENPRLQGNRDQNNNNCFSIDSNGVVFEKSSYENQSLILRDDMNKDISLGDNVIGKSIMDMISKIKDSLYNNFQIDIREVLISNPLVVKTSEGWQIYFDPYSNTDLEISKMNALLKDGISPAERKNLQYIYLQYKDRAYYK